MTACAARDETERTALENFSSGTKMSPQLRAALIVGRVEPNMGLLFELPTTHLARD